VSPKSVGSALITDTAINPVKILILFISMTIMSIFLDELGFFSYLANWSLKHAGTSQTRLFILLYVTVSVLTVFTSNDIIILSFTPFVCYFAKNAHIDPTPYLAGEFIAANTWSMALIIGNPTNIYLVTAAGGDFVSYVKVMLVPTLVAGIVSGVCLFAMFFKKFSVSITASPDDVKIADKTSLWIGVVHLVACTLALAFSSYIGIEMWLISFVSVLSLLFCNVLAALIRKKNTGFLPSCLKRAPWELIPFVISMFVIVEGLGVTGVTDKIFEILGDSYSTWKYGVSSFIASNFINNIPMSVLYSSILANSPSNLSAVYATVVGSNLGACLTPIGALAGIMWVSILKEHGLKFGYIDFLKVGGAIAIPSLVSALGILGLIL
ncbi:MAG: hypothetical protein IJN40_02290, partial [Clostridia bacterium]|nr:hypothetical protein [Clostridia bacterium]